MTLWIWVLAVVAWLVYRCFRPTRRQREMIALHDRVYAVGAERATWPLSHCDECTTYWQAHRDSPAFAATVGIERGLTTNQSLYAYFRDFHKAGHRER